MTTETGIVKSQGGTWEQVIPVALYEVVRQEARTRFGIDPTQIYCLHTGRPIGTSHEFTELVDLLADESDVTGAVVTRVLAAMKPSIRWQINTRVDWLEKMLKAYPVDTMCYLLGRLLTPTKEQKGLDSYQVNHLSRIKLYACVAAEYAALTPTLHESWSSAMLSLLTIEARANLLTQESPVTIEQLIEGRFSVATVVGTLEAWCMKRVAFFDKSEADAKFFSANPGARRAMMRQFWEVKPKAESTIKKEAKQREVNTLGAMLDELLSPGITATKPESQRPAATPAPKVTARTSTKMPMRFGVKKVEG